MAASDDTTIRVSRDTRDELAESKPYDSMSYDELLQEMLENHSARGAEI